MPVILERSHDPDTGGWTFYVPGLMLCWESAPGHEAYGTVQIGGGESWSLIDVTMWFTDPRRHLRLPWMTIDIGQKLSVQIGKQPDRQLPPGFRQPWVEFFRWHRRAEPPDSL